MIQAPSVAALVCSRRYFLTATILGGVVPASAFGNAFQATKKEEKMNPRLYTFIGGDTGEWKVVSLKAVIGDGLPKAEKLAVVHGQSRAAGKWALHGVTSNERYVTRPEKG